MSFLIIQGDARHVPLADNAVHCVITSPPFFGLRDYNVAGQLGLETTIEAYVANLVAVFREVWRVLRKDGTVWLNLGDSYSGSWGNYSGQNRGNGTQRTIANGSRIHQPSYDGLEQWRPPTTNTSSAGLKNKDLCMIPARVALALQADGWTLRSMIPWLKRNPMPESVLDRPASAIEYIFLLTKTEKYYYDAEAIKQPSVTKDPRRPYTSNGAKMLDGRSVWHSGERRNGTDFSARARRNSDWFFDSWQGLLQDEDDDPLALVVNTNGYKGAHFATFPSKLIEPLIKAGSSEKGVCTKCGGPYSRSLERRVMQPGITGGKTLYDKHRPDGGILRAGGFGAGSTTTLGWQPSCTCNAPRKKAVLFDPFGGAGTVGFTADRLGRDAICMDLSRPYCEMGKTRIIDDAPLLHWGTS